MPRNIIVGVGGGIAAYKACALVRNLTESGENVTVIPTDSALRFVGAASFEALSGNPVGTSVFDGVDEVRHVRLGKEAGGIVIAPATADLMARLAHGRADDLLAATVLVATCPVVLAPAMHTEMWHNPATRTNVELLRQRGITVLEPASGRLTGADSGAGRLPEPEQIADLARTVFDGADFTRVFQGRRFLITAGGTQEDLDPVRYLGNRSSGRQGFALAEVAGQLGANVELVAGATADLPVPSNTEVIRVSSAEDMKAAVEERASSVDAIIMSAAVSDFRPVDTAGHKLKKGTDDDSLATVSLVENPDILRGLVESRAAGRIPQGTVIAGFAAETGDGETSALEFGRRKLASKGCDLIMCNDVGNDQVFGQATNRGWLLTKNHETVVEVASKYQVAAQLLAELDSLV